MKSITRDAFERIEKQRLLDDFRTIDRRMLTNLDDKALTEWQSKFPDSSPHRILAEAEWNRRLLVDQIRATKHAAWIGVWGTIFGAIAGGLIAKL